MSQLENYAVKNDVRFDTAQWMQAIGPPPIPLDNSPTIVLNPSAGSDSNDGQTGSVATFERAVELANTYENPTISVVGASIDLGSSATYRANNNITVSGSVTTELSSVVVTATPQDSLSRTLITVSNTLTPSALEGFTLTFTSGSLNGVSYAIGDNAAGSITIAGNAGAAPGDRFVVTSPVSTLAPSDTSVMFVGTWTFENATLGSGSGTLLVECDSCITLTNSSVAIELSSVEHSLIRATASNINDDVTSTFGDSWSFTNCYFGSNSNTLTLSNTDNLFVNAWFNGAVPATSQVTATFRNCYINSATWSVESQSVFSFESSFWENLSGTYVVAALTDSSVSITGTTTVNSNATSAVLYANNSKLSTSTTLAVNTSVTADVVALDDRATAIIEDGGTTTITGNVSRGFFVGGCSELKIDSAVTFTSGGTGTLLLYAAEKSSVITTNTIVCAGYSVTTYIQCDSSSLYLDGIGSLAGTTSSRGLLSQGDSAIEIVGSFSMSGVGLNGMDILPGARVTLNTVSGTITGGVTGIDLQQSTLVTSGDCSGLTVSSAANDIIVDGLASLVSDTTNVFALGTPQYVYGGTTVAAQLSAVASRYLIDATFGSVVAVTF